MRLSAQILDWTSDFEDAEQRITELLDFAYPRIDAYEATHRATLHLALDQWRRRQTGTLGGEEEVERGHRRELLAEAVNPLKRRVSRPTFDRLIQSLSLIFGAEAMVVLKDIWGLDEAHARRVAIWAAHALVRAAVAEKAPVRAVNDARRTNRNAAKRPRKKRA